MKQKRDHTQLICDISELSALFAHSRNLEGFLQNITELIAGHMNADVCSVYLYFDESRQLQLKATTGLNKSYIGNVHLKIGEGLTGLAAKELRPICERHASLNPNFRYFPELGEEKFESFLAVPIVRGKMLIGAMVIQNAESNYFTDEDIRILQAITSQLANTIEMTRLILALEAKPAPLPATAKGLKIVRGQAGSAGFAYGETVVINAQDFLTKDFSAGKSPMLTLDDFEKALERTFGQLEHLQKVVEEKVSDVSALIFTAQILILKDQHFMDAVKALIVSGISPAEALIRVVRGYLEKFEKIDDLYLRERGHDIQDVGRRLLNNLLGINEKDVSLENKIVIASELFPSDTIKLVSQNVRGIVVLSGGISSHLSILSRSFHIPLMITGEQRLLSLPDHTRAILDCEAGNLYIDPDTHIKKMFQDKIDLYEKKQTYPPVSDRTVTSDGIEIRMLANINLLCDLKTARDFKLDGIGLYRTEFPFMIRPDFPNEEEQFLIYRRLAQGVSGREIVFRTLDIGGDKILSYFEQHAKEQNPFLGMRSIRFSLKHPDIFTAQIRAILRAGSGEELRIMFPMISSMDEFLEAKGMVNDCVKDLQREGKDCHGRPLIGAMLELPSVLEFIDDLAEESDFLSIGTNDFIQYMLAVDRTNEKVADMYLPHHPSILRGLKKMLEAAHRHQCDISICGDMSYDPQYLEFLIGIGLRKFSINPGYLPKVQKVIQNIDSRKAGRFADELLKLSSLKAIQSVMHAETR